ncbi:hypothetical protein [Pyrococcus abyssi]|uniref:HEPN domain-containing protein n=1 Tax=Pyrococcus abyssi (strain GE5 / Orsay) TaxID=272844 RepID=Q9UYJ0_PYRAB|nr:hypothetical protein [Pyrococcus abyssi]CAB50422.1 Hypothetical protein PAB1360 [Pyrococcus abyssi GE5]CCE70971.1 TPA: hypothetical protein PAB1360 [Pyrococcus abyssi GE5]
MPINLDDLRANIDEYIEVDEMAFKRGKYNSALIMYFKALVGICDYIIKKELNLEPKNHGERFSILRRYYPDLYRTVDKFFNFYRDAYERRITKREVGELRNEVLRLTDRIR